MGDQDHDSFFSSIMLKNIDNEIPIAFDEATPSKATTPTTKSPSSIIGDVTPVYKKKSKNSKDNDRPVSILSNISKIYERCIYDQIQLFFDSLLSKYQCGFRRGYNAQHCLITIIEKWKKSVDNGGAFGALLTDLSKAFDCLPHELLIATIDAYGFDKSSLKLMHSYLSNRKQRVKINDTYSS